MSNKNKDGLNIFYHLKQIIREDDPEYYKMLDEDDRKDYRKYMLQRFLSMNHNWLFLVNFLNKYVNTLDNNQYHKIASELIPNQQNTYYEYISNNKENYSKEMIDYVKQYFKVSSNEAIDYIEIMDNDKVIELLSKYGLDDKKLDEYKDELKEEE